MKKLKLFITSALVAVCAFMMVGCGELNAKQAVNESVTVSQSIESTANSMSDTKLNSAMNVSSFTEYLEQLGDLTTSIATKSAEVATTLAHLTTEIAELKINQTAFAEKFESLEIVEEDINTLNEQLNVLKDVKKNIEKDYQTLEAKMQSAVEKMQEVTILTFDENTINSIINHLETAISEAVSLLNKGVGYVETATTALEKINTVVAKYIAE